MKFQRIDPKTDYETYQRILNRYLKFLENINNVDSTPVKVFDALPSRLVDQLELIREASKTLQIKKDEDIKKAAQKMEEAQQENAEEKPEGEADTEQTEEVAEEKKEE